MYPEFPTGVCCGLPLPSAVRLCLTEQQNFVNAARLSLAAKKENEPSESNRLSALWRGTAAAFLDSRTSQALKLGQDRHPTLPGVVVGLAVCLVSCGRIGCFL